MRILGIDPGYERIGYGLVDRDGSKLAVVAFGLIQTPKIALGDRLLQIHREVTALIETHAPDTMAVERLFFAKNQTTAIDVAKAAGCIILAATQKGLSVSEYSPPEVKQSLTGVGNAEKKQVQFMVTRLLGLAAAPKPDDVADALAVAITHAFRTRI